MFGREPGTDGINGIQNSTYHAGDQGLTASMAYKTVLYDTIIWQTSMMNWHMPGPAGPTVGKYVTDGSMALAWRHQWHTKTALLPGRLVLNFFLNEHLIPFIQ